MSGSQPGTPSGSSATSDLVILRCPSCNAAEPVKAAALAERPRMIRCRRCGTHWPARLDMVTGGQLVDPRRQSVAWADAGAIDDIRRPLVGYAEDNDPWAAQRAAPPAPPKPARRGRSLNVIASALALAFLVGAVVGREAAVAAVPDLAGLYAAIGLPVNLRGLEIGSVSGARRVTGQAIRLTVSGQVTNVGAKTRDVPALVISLYDEEDRKLGEEQVAAPVPSLGAGAAVRFVVDLERAPREASTVRVRFDGANESGRPDRQG